MSIIGSDMSLIDMQNGAILPYYIEQDTNEVYVLLGKEKRDLRNIPFSKLPRTKGYYCWEPFGGNWEPHGKDSSLFDNNTANTVEKAFEFCLREMYEESHLILSTEYTPLYLKSSNYVIFLVRMPEKISIDMLDFNCLSLVDEKQDDFTFQAFPFKNLQDKFAYKEKTAYQWFKKTELHEMADFCEEHIIKQYILVDNNLSIPHFKTLLAKQYTDGLVSYLFIPFLRNNHLNKWFTQLEYSHQKVYSNKAEKESSLDTLFDQKILHEQKSVQAFKWSTVIYCLLYYKNNDQEYEIYTCTNDQKASIYCYPLYERYDTKESLLYILNQLGKKVSAKLPTTKDLNNFLQDSYFQINVYKKTAYCAIEITQPLLKTCSNFSDEDDCTDHDQYANSFAAFKSILLCRTQIKVCGDSNNVLFCERPSDDKQLKIEGDSSRDSFVKKKLDDQKVQQDNQKQLQKPEINNNTKNQPELRRTNNWLETIKFYCTHRYCLTTLTISSAFLVALYYVYIN